jgi:hypothetical protein
VLKVLEIFEQQKSLRSFTSSLDNVRSMAGDVNPGNSSRTVARNILTLCAAQEIFLTKQLLAMATVCGVAQDARDAYLLICVRMVLWKLPAACRNPMPDGIQSFGERGPWVVERILSTSPLGADRTAVATAQATIKAIRDTVKTNESFEECQHKFLFYCTDNAADESMAGEIAGKGLPRLTFKMSDSSHSLMLAIKNGCKGDPEVDAVQGIFLTNKKPHPSIANLLRHSKRFRSAFTDEQQEDVFGTLSHLGWSPQRMTSRARSYGRGILKIDALLMALAKEAEGGARAEAALHNLRELAKYNRLMIAGMLADFTVEHQLMVRHTDVADPDPVEVPQLMRQFVARDWTCCSCRARFFAWSIYLQRRSSNF